MRFRGLAEATAVVLAGLALACALTYPYALKYDHAGRLDTNDGRFSIWVVTWVARAFATNPATVYDANIFHPHQKTLAFSEAEIVEGLVAAPVWALTKNPYTTHNFLFIMSFVLSSAGGYYLVRHLTGDRRAAVLAGVLFAYCPFVFARTAHIQLMMIGFLPFCLLSFHRLVDRPGVARAIELGVVLCLTGLSCAYYGIFAGLIVGLGTLMLAVTRRRVLDAKYWMLIGLAAAVCIGLTLPAFLPYIELQEQTGFGRTLDDARQYSANFGAWFASSAWAHRWWLPYIEGFSEVLFPGILALVFGLWGTVEAMRRTPAPAGPEGDLNRLKGDTLAFYVVTLVLAFWTSLGPKAGLYTLLFHTVPVFSLLRAPARTGIVVTLCLVVLATIPIRRLMRGRHARLVFAGVLLVALAELAEAPLRMRDAPPLPRAYTTLALLPRGPVIEFPYWYTRPEFPRHAEYMLTSTSHWQPLINGYSDHIPQDFRDTVRPLSGFPSAESFAILEGLGARYAVFHFDKMDRNSREQIIRRIEVDYGPYLRPLETDGDVWLLEIVDWPR